MAARWRRVLCVLPGARHLWRRSLYAEYTSLPSLHRCAARCRRVAAFGGVWRRVATFCHSPGGMAIETRRPNIPKQYLLTNPLMVLYV